MEKELLKYLLETANNTSYTFFEIRGGIVFAKEGNTGQEREYNKELIKKIINHAFKK